uniref:Large ribosomal subunit protein uL13c n=3 Tax=cellular organisms TaxID=131567 RepID=RK13_PYRYE|nr:ribosomal protein L13 [Neopyropia yezoensis]Q1XDJ6.1 RecName: Full=Large ribosomal subunit protein uL13c; AltName: Full=50S ribosomal protein L13, chloroplastic [Neopyropia yezoensis]ABJ91316.1 50S ribosomal protein L13 [Neopyropia yezoensis]AGH27618.1 ribosomal protein L13 [Neopyropia yezoensis]QFZ66954.1 ribosomal protein L13 [Neopyropia yezoensis]ULU28933.1 ribosomal protein L13 [Neopyropia yezoensis]WKD83449.1 ribosomal protein L13 [Neopyropia yezoensis]
MNKTQSPSLNTNSHWYVIDAKNQTLGRISTHISNILRGKNKPSYTPYLDTGDYVIVINSAHVSVSGNKTNQKLYRRHSGQPGGLKVETFDQLQTRLPNRIIEKSVKGMLPKGPLGRKLFTKLKVYSGPIHPHVAQKPQEYIV